LRILKTVKTRSMKSSRSWAYEKISSHYLVVDVFADAVYVFGIPRGNTVMPSARHRNRVEEAYKDALMLATWRANGIIPSRRYALIYGITQNRFENAIGLLRMARIIVKHRTWVTDDLSTIKAQLKRAKEYALEVPEAYHARLSEHAKN
jgi:hypothetical protein